MVVRTPCTFGVFVVLGRSHPADCHSAAQSRARTSLLMSDTWCDRCSLAGFAVGVVSVLVVWESRHVRIHSFSHLTHSVILAPQIYPTTAVERALLEEEDSKSWPVRNIRQTIV
jgi:hypothetical protein